ncbi:MAG: helix-turn-helix transcriptional regulator, partial [Treponema sp.]|nr:helix-turn-helix transcriptional regulator [Treponema sp.]
KMGVAWSAYQRIENPRKTNPTLSTIEKLQKVFGRPFFAF